MCALYVLEQLKKYSSMQNGHKVLNFNVLQAFDIIYFLKRRNSNLQKLYDFISE